jgi:hypothetical protein
VADNAKTVSAAKRYRRMGNLGAGLVIAPIVENVKKNRRFQKTNPQAGYDIVGRLQLCN